MKPRPDAQRRIAHKQRIFMENGDIYQMLFLDDLILKFEYRLIDKFNPK